MTNLKTISSLVGFYTTELQNKIHTNLTLTLENSGSVSVNSGVNKEHSCLTTQFPSSQSDEKCLQYIKSDIQAIVCDMLGVDKSYLYMYGDRELVESEIGQINEKIIRYRNGEPLAYILGYKYFWDQKLRVTQDTLIPRADTEVLVETILESIGNNKDQYLRDSGSGSGNSDVLKEKDTLKILDLGTGTGAIALALAGELQDAEITAVDFSVKALVVAKENAVSNNIANVRFIQSDWYEALDGMKFDIIVSNPPYIDNSDSDIDAEVKAYEPTSALFADDNGLSDIAKIISQAQNFLVENGSVYIEHGYTQSTSVHAIFKKYGFVDVETIKDFNGRDRCTKANKVF
ncbi:MAG: release factor glutamine methyltransferase [Francisella sp.]|jgi:release factor glutamine methyltransferase